MTTYRVYSIDNGIREEFIKFRQMVMQPGTASTYVALNSGVHANVISGVDHQTGSLRGESWMDSALQKPVQFAVKRALDIIVSSAAIVVLLPFLAAIALAIAIESRGPVLFRQMRWGRGGQLIRIYKFRSMRADMCDSSGVQQTRADDPRVTRIGAFLRKTNLDEIPQLLNILIGDMSLVGPRCHVPGMLAAGVPYEELVREYHLRHLVRPGLTGLAQMNGLRGPTDREDLARSRIVHDLEYIRNFSVWSDLRIIWRTALNEVRGGSGF